ncbi:MAG: carboxypeptidase-like regulatory domain-containing protein, partial [Bacteroidaceae bacterium]|nr:carboxypeptidase-like regulatory domain-containing protein [Bacteroidaceae bacterium]
MSTKQMTHKILCFLLCLLCAPALYAQSATSLTGTVTDEFGAPLPGASVAIMKQKKMLRGTSTNIHGDFKIEVNTDTPNTELVVSFVGTKTVKIKLTES